MSTRITSQENKVALFDSLSNTAFGPVFDSEEDAESFLQWMRRNELSDRVITFPDNRFRRIRQVQLRFFADVRKYKSDELDFFYNLWADETSHDNPLGTVGG